MYIWNTLQFGFFESKYAQLQKDAADQTAAGSPSEDSLPSQQDESWSDETDSQRNFLMIFSTYVTGRSP